MTEKCYGASKEHKYFHIKLSNVSIYLLAKAKTIYFPKCT